MPKLPSVAYKACHATSVRRVRPNPSLKRKQQINEAIALNTTRLSVSLQDQRTAILRSTLPGTLRVFFGSAIVSAFLFMLKRQI
jgi:hypothetical protein